MREMSWAAGVRMTSALRWRTAPTQIWRAARSASIDTSGRLAPRANQVNSWSLMMACESGPFMWEPVRIRPGHHRS